MFVFSFLQWGWFLEIENEEMVMDDKQVDTIADRKRPIGEFLSIKSIYSNLCFVFLSIPIVRLYRVLLISCFNGFLGFNIYKS